jgi:Neuraminidase (sialidase)
MAISGSRIFIVWDDSTPGNKDILMRRSTDGGATWKAFKNLSNNAGLSFHAQVAVSGSNVYFAWRDGTGGPDEILLRRSTNNGGTLQPIVQISNNAGFSIAPALTTVGNNVYVIWQDNTPGNYDIFDRRSTDNGATWKAVQNLSNNAGISSFPQMDG